jgi:hypothetical protein
MVIVPAIGPNALGFKPSRGDGFKLSENFVKILWHVKITSKYEHRYFEGQIHFIHQDPPALLLDDCW